jgi:hypothetical protein
MNLQSSTLKNDESGRPFHVQQAEQIRIFREARKAAGHARELRVSVSRSIFALVDDRDRIYFGRENGNEDTIGFRRQHPSHFWPQLGRRAGRPHRTTRERRSHRRRGYAALDRASSMSRPASAGADVRLGLRCGDQRMSRRITNHSASGQYDRAE